jgi:hypothetical protein
MSTKDEEPDFDLVPKIGIDQKGVVPIGSGSPKLKEMLRGSAALLWTGRVLNM